ncbi:hypothetical protein [Pontibacter pamirensis]|uniref:hypothetical protein n=1 Tax=Pontibacter pamirensis TaxID=2562824 RepID=UPI0013898A2A|nr:hypothetical protein [Pontibacter pamirensis]
MILYENGFIRLEYDASTDLLYVDGPDVQGYALMGVYEASNIILGAIGKYNIKRLLIDSSETIVDVSQEDYKVVMNQFTRELMKTSLQKVVRVATSDAARESGVEKYVKQVNQRAKPSLAFQNFTSRAAAIAWLRAE